MAIIGTCAFLGYTTEAREYWNAQAFAVKSAATKYKFGECPGCNVGMNSESDYVMIVRDGTESPPFIRCIQCYQAIFVTGD